MQLIRAYLIWFLPLLLIACAKPADEAAKLINGVATQMAFNPDGTYKAVSNPITNVPCRSDNISVHGMTFELKAKLQGDGKLADADFKISSYYGDDQGSNKDDASNQVSCVLQATWLQKGLNLTGGGQLKDAGLDYSCTWKRQNISHDDLKKALEKYSCQ